MIRSGVRTLSFFGTWMAELMRHPGLILSLVGGPFLILLAFGLGVQTSVPRPRVLVVGTAAQDPEIRAKVSEHVQVVGETSDLAFAREQLRKGIIDLVAVLPPDPRRDIQEGRHPRIQVITSEIDPTRDAFAQGYLRELVSSLNETAVRRSVEDVQQQAGPLRDAIAQGRQQIDAARELRAPGDPAASQLEIVYTRLDQAGEAVDRIERVPSELLSAPFQVSTENIAPFVPSAIGFYGPAVVVLILQHLAVTLGALSMTRVRLLGVLDLLRASPVKPTEVVVGHYLSYGILCLVAAALLAALLVYVLEVPVFGPYQVFVGTLALLVLAGLGIGFVVAMIASTEQQAAQLVMLILLASIFFSGLIFTLDQVRWPLRAVSYALPATYSIRTLQDVMLRGILRTPVDLVVLSAAALLMFVAAVTLFRREFRAR